MRLIDADEFKVKIAELLEDNNEPYSHYCDGYQDAVEWVDDLLDAQPTIEPVKRGKWINQSPFDWKCSECGFEVEQYCDHKKCPSCDATMESESE